MPATVESLLVEAWERFGSASFKIRAREATMLLARLMEVDEAVVLAHGERPVAAAVAQRFRRLIERRRTGEPMAYILGEKEFWGRRFAVDRRVLIPRPESEHLVDAALSKPYAKLLVDLGTGSGCLAITLLAEFPWMRGIATDRSPGALAVAAANARTHEVDGRLNLVAGDLLSPLGDDDTGAIPCDLVIANLPYIDPADRASLSPEITGFEPHSALFADEGGLGVIDELFGQAERLPPGCLLLLEIGDGQAGPLTARLDGRPLELVRIERDLAGKERVMVLERTAGR